MISSARQGGSFLQSYRDEWQHFAGCVLHGIPPGSTFDDGRRALELVLAAIDSARSGHPVDVGRLRRTDERAESPG